MNERMIEVCDKCLRACCWQGYFMCEENQNAGTTHKSISELKALNLEHSDYWKHERDVIVEVDADTFIDMLRRIDS